MYRCEAYSGNSMDDRIEEIEYDMPRDLVGIFVKTFTARRAYQIADEWRKRCPQRGQKAG